VPQSGRNLQPQIKEFNVKNILITERLPAVVPVMIIKIEKSAFGGHSLAFIDRKAVFIPYTIPGETVRIDDIVDKKDYFFAHAVAIEEASPDRIVPECLNFSRCGGCDYLHMSYERECAEKIQIINDSLRRIAKMNDDDLPAIKQIAGERFHYRSHASIKQANFKKGFYAKDSHAVVPFPHGGCLLLGKGLHDAAARFQTDKTEYKVAVDRSGMTHAALPGEQRVIEEECSGIKYKRDIHSFFQANMKLRAAMAEQVLACTAPEKSDTILELGCGSGFFSLLLARHCASVHGIEIAADAVHFADINKKLNATDNVLFECRSNDSLDAEKDKADIVFVDPPRPGLSKRTRSVLTAIAPRKIVYVSCNPSTWARDVKEFADASYLLSDVAFIDMFPGTQHIEIVSSLIKK
jgi:23S rRNA (uracil1939-C5)-methyltransferase